MSEYLFGPVPSRRLGRSLGIDLVPHKTVPEDIREKLAHTNGIDYLTFSGSGEPILHTQIGQLIRELKRLSPGPISVLTNGSLLWQKEVQDDLLAADLVIPSLDAPDKSLSRHFNRPHPDLVFEKVIEGLVRFRERYQGRIWLEIFLLAANY